MVDGEKVGGSAATRIDEHFVQEYLYSTQAWDDFDNRILTIKGWTAAGGLAAIVAGLGAKELSSPIMVGAALVIVSLWFLEAQWRIFQHSNHARIEALEAYFAGKRPLSAPFQSHTLSALVRTADGWTAWPKELFTPFVFTPYLPLVFLLGVIAAARWMTPEAAHRAATLMVSVTPQD